MVGYSKWEFGEELARELKEDWGLVGDGNGDGLERRDPVGLNDELAEKMSGDILACREGVIGDRPRIGIS